MSSKCETRRNYTCGNIGKFSKPSFDSEMATPFKERLWIVFSWHKEMSHTDKVSESSSSVFGT